MIGVRGCVVMVAKKLVGCSNIERDSGGWNAGCFAGEIGLVVGYWWW